MKFLDKLPWHMVIMAAVLLGLAPVFNAQGEFEPHLVEKLGMLFAGTLSKPIDIFDLFLHGTPSIILLLKLIRHFSQSGANGTGSDANA